MGGTAIAGVFNRLLDLQLSCSTLRIATPHLSGFFLEGDCRTTNIFRVIISRAMILLLLTTLIFSTNLRAQQTFFPPAIPLAVRSPYLNTWDYLTNGSIFGQTWPTTFNNSMVCRPRLSSWP